MGRGREVDREVPLKYFESLTEILEDQLEINGEKFNILKTYTDDLDLANSEEDINSVLDRIKNETSRIEEECGLMPFFKLN